MTSIPIGSALERVLTRYTTMVRAVGRRHGLADGDLDEVVQDVRIRLWRAIPSGERIAAVSSSYVYRTAMSAALDLIGRRRLRRERSVDPGEPAEQRRFGTTAGPEVALARRELVSQVARAVDGLAESRRAVVRMYLAGYSQPEIAELLGWTSAKTRNLLYRGLADLREALIRQGIGPEIRS